MSDEIAITGIRGFGYHGLLDAEKRNGQEFLVDIRITADLSQAGQSDQIESTIDYAKVAIRVKELIESGPFNLIERLAEVIAVHVKREFRAIEVEVRVHKPHAPIDLDFEDVSVTITR